MRKAYPNRLLIMACSATKSDAPGRIPVIERYDGPLWQTLRAVDPDESKARLGYLSARFGFGSAWDWLENYDEKLTEVRAAELIEGGITKNWPKQTARARNRGLPPGGQSAWPSIELLSDHGRQPFAEVCIVGGHLYLEVMRAFVDDFRKPHWNNFEWVTPWVLPEAPLVEINGPIGVMRQQLRAWLDKPSQLGLPLAA